MHQAALRKSVSEKNDSSASEMEYENNEAALDSSNHEENQNGEDATDDVQETVEGNDDESASANDENDDETTVVEKSVSPKEKTKRASKGKSAKKEKKKAKAATNGVKKTPKRSTKENKAQNDQNDDDDEEEEYEVEDIVDHKVVRGKTSYRIRWKGWSEDDDTWEGEETLSCPDIVARYKKKMKEDGAKKSPGSAKKTAGKRKGIPIKLQTKSKVRKVDDENPDKEWEVDRIVDVRYKKSGREFLIKWKGWGANYDSWEPEKHLNCPELIKKVLEKVESAKSKTPKQLRDAPKKPERYTTNAKNKGVRASRRNNNKQRKTYFDAE
ncbi:hypothetical protein DMENIID0001_107570 [Sergentomyia squamirostris]